MESVQDELEHYADEFKQTAKDIKMHLAEAHNKALEAGFFSHFGEFNNEIFKPLKRVNHFSWEAVKAELIGTLTLHPPNPESEFVFYNVLALLVGIAESLFSWLLLDGGYISLTWNGAASYMVAYTIYWIMLCHGDKKLMFGALIFLLLYVAFSVLMTISTLIYVLPATLYAIKAFCNLEMFISGFWLYDTYHGDGSWSSLLPCGGAGAMV